ncbi:phosphatidylinositol alpha 1,6-mannosyltransferase [Knoellia remsis]|uniref:D-inositol 3-phosphate glycosyltransferase n=1 Tax=Knoellia remsis TaxID=407159 RepID=A0A2T0UQD1_9MICO|nr:glycosyltransferase family 1 protein [Knoellia remsis]PRY60123.1 phosphatidylinositol alpha 1,6-mannosyltransferase [Knoellia remsis]
MRVAMVTESFLPTLNGVTTSVCRVARSLRALGHEALIIAPAPAPERYEGFEVRSLPSVSVRQFPTGVPTPGLRHALEDFEPDVVHAASPFILGARALQLADRTGTPSVAIYQTDMPSYIQQHGPGRIGSGAANAAWRWIRRMHAHADLTLAPSTATLAELRQHGVPRTALWRRGVDTALFSPRWRTDPGTAELKRALAPGGEVLLGYVGRLAPEKELWRLTEVAQIPGTRLIIVGDGPSRSQIGAQLTEAVASMPGRPNRSPVFLGRQSGDDLARAYAAFDVFVHTGTRETFGQTLQEAAAFGLPVVAPARGGPLDLVDHGRTGLLFDPDRPGSLHDHVDALVGDGDWRVRMGEAAEAAVRGRSWECLTEQLVGHYRAASDARFRRAA